MSTPIIDPSEIIIDKTGTIKEDTLHANPWIRFLARFADYALFFSLIWALRALFGRFGPLEKVESFVPLPFFVWIPIEAVLLSTWGTTPGKWFLKIKLRQGKRMKFPFALALKRAFNVWLRGLGMMIPIINGLCLLTAFYRLKTLQATTWDKEEHIVVTHAPVGRWRVAVAAVLSIATLLFRTEIL